MSLSKFLALPILLSFSTMSRADNACQAQAYANYQLALSNCGTSQPEEWRCTTRLGSTRSHFDPFGRCRGQGDRDTACYHDATETCRETHTGQERVVERQEFFGCFQDTSCD